MTEHETESAVDTTSAGRWLAQVRVERNLSVADVAAKLRLAPRQIEAIEADDYQRLPGRTIVRGFVRNYARLLQLDPAQVVAAYEKIAPSDADVRISLPHQNVQFSEVDSGHRNRSTLRMTLGVGIVLVIGILAWFWEVGIANAPKPTTAAVTVPHVAGSEPSSVVTPSAPQTIKVDPQTPPGVSVETPAVSPAADPAVGAAATDRAPVPASIAENLVHLIFDGPSWVEVRDGNGKILMQKSNPAGTEQDITAALPLTFTIGNAAKVKMTHNGDPYDLAPHIQGSIARFKLER